MTGTAEAALAHLCQEAKKSLDPQLDATAIEARVLAHLRRSSVDSRILPRSRSIRAHLKPYVWPAALATAAVVAFVWTHWPSPRAIHVAASQHQAQLANEPWTDGTVLGVGQVLEAHEHDVTVNYPGIATWRLTAASRARIVEQGRRITVALERGRIDAKVVPQPQPEVFAVEIEQVRVAVHGTVFTVQRDQDVAEVVVTEGSVRLGTSDQRGNSQGDLLTAPARMSIDVHPHESGKRDGAHVTSLPKAQLRSPTKPEQYERAAVTLPEPNLAETPSAAEVERVWESISRGVSQCFTAQTGGEPNVRVSFNTKISVQLAADGSVAISSFDPPVSEPVYQCAAQQVAPLRTPPTKSGAFMSREKTLMR